VLNKLGTAAEAEQEMTEIRASLAEHHSGRLFSFGVLVIFIGIMLSVFQQFIGINVVLYYAPEIFKGMGLSTNASLWQTIIVGAVNLIFTVVAVLTVDKYGRKPLQIIGGMVMAASMIGLGTNFMLHGAGMIALLCMLGYIAGFAMSWGPVTWVLFERNIPEPDSRQGDGRGCGRPMDCQLSRQLDVSDAGRQPRFDQTLQSRIRLLDLRRK